jgi:hypothetical protein
MTSFSPANCLETVSTTHCNASENGRVSDLVFSLSKSMIAKTSGAFASGLGELVDVSVPQSNGTYGFLVYL